MHSSVNSRVAIVSAVVLLLLVGGWFYRSPSGPSGATPASSAGDHPATPTPANSGTPSLGIAQAPPIGVPAARAVSNLPPNIALPPPAQGTAAIALRQLDQINRMLRDYRTLFGSNPIGTNAEIMKAVMGGNPKKARLGPPEGMSLNDSGELVDPWGTPFFFHQVSGEHMEIRSAGQDKRMWTSDDLVWK
jgi:hypothetical protein